MANSRVIFHRLAAREFRGARDWYAAQSIEVAQRFQIAVNHAVGRIANNAEALALLQGEYRWVRVRRFPYTLIFRRDSQTVVKVIAVPHTSRRPGYWRRRK